MICKLCSHSNAFSGNHKVCGLALQGGETVYIKNGYVEDALCPLHELEKKCPECNGTGWYGDNGPGGPGSMYNREYIPCECKKSAAVWTDSDCPRCGYPFLAKDRHGLYCCFNDCGYVANQSLGGDS